MYSLDQSATRTLLTIYYQVPGTAVHLLLLVNEYEYIRTRLVSTTYPKLLLHTSVVK